MQISLFAHRLVKTKVVTTCLAVGLTAGLSLVSVENVLAQMNNPQASNAATQGQPLLQRRKRGIDAELIDQGDYYMHPDGRQIRLMRKKDVYVVDSNDSERSIQRVKSQYGERVAEVRSLQLGAQRIVKIDNSESTKQRRSETFDVNASMLENTDNTIRRMRPVFSNSEGEGDILLMPKLTVKLNSGVNPANALNRLDSRYGLTVDRKLRLSGNVYSLSLKNTLSESQQFALVRRVMNDNMIEWAEPQFSIGASKTSFEPNDTLFGDQWHLQNSGLEGSRCDADCDANNAWGIDIDNNSGNGGSGQDEVTGNGMVIAIIDDGVELNHPDLNYWTNPGESQSNNNSDQDGNGYVDDWRGWDFVDDSSTNPRLEDALGNGAGSCSTGWDGDLGPDNDPSPQATSDCTLPQSSGDPVNNDDHGTAVAGLAAAIGNNMQGVAGTAYNAQILPIRLVSDFNTDFTASVGLNTASFCVRAAEAIEYAGRYADVVSNSWSLDVSSVPCMALETAIANVTAGMVMDEATNVSKRPSLGSPVLFSSGNQASGWVKVTIPITAGEHAYEWRFLRDGLFPSPENGDHAWLDDITWPDGSTENFEGAGSLASRGFDIGNVSAGDSCIAGCTGFFQTGAAWSIVTSPEAIIPGTTQAAQIDAASPADCSNTYLYTLRDEPISGNISFWVWVDSDTQADKFEFLVDGKERLSFGDAGLAQINGSIAYPASLSGTIPGVIAVGASNSGDLSGTVGTNGNNSVPAANKDYETRAYYSQYGPNLDVLAPSSDQLLGIVTTDRSGADGYDSTAYTNTFGGTSASTPITAGIAAAIIAVDPTQPANGVRAILRNTADEIGNAPYTAGRNDFYGYGRVNMYAALLDAAGITNGIAYSGACAADQAVSFVSAHNIFAPVSGQFCPAIGDIPVSDELCFPIKAANGNVAVICL